MTDFTCAFKCFPRFEKITVSGSPLLGGMNVELTTIKTAGGEELLLAMLALT